MNGGSWCWYWRCAAFGWDSRASRCTARIIILRNRLLLFCFVLMVVFLFTFPLFCLGPPCVSTTTWTLLIWNVLHDTGI